MQSTYLDFERPLEELDRQIEEARARKSPVADIAELETRGRDLEAQLYGELSPWYRVQLSRHPDRPQTLDYAGQIFDEFTELHGDRGFADDPSIVGGFARLRGPSGDAGRPSTRAHDAGKAATELWHAEARRIPQGAASLSARGTLSSSDRHHDRHPRRIPGPGRRRARSSGGDRSESPRNGCTEGSGGGVRDRRGRKRRRVGARHRRSDLDVRVRLLFGDHPRGVRVDPLSAEDRRVGRPGRGCAAPDGQGSACSRSDRRESCPSRSGEPTVTLARRWSRSVWRSIVIWPSCRAGPADRLRDLRYEKFRRMGQFVAA